MEPWRQLSVQDSAEKYDDFRFESMCCSAVFLKRDFDICRVCGGHHTMTEHRLKCTSKTCSDLGTCQITWKVFICSGQGTWTIWMNTHGHIRDVVPCSTDHPVRITAAMKVFLSEQEEIGIPPRLMLVNWKKQHSTSAPGSTRVLPTLKQIHNALKRIRRDQGSKNSRSFVQQLMRLRCYRPGMDADAAFLYGSKLDKDGYGYVGNGSDKNPFIVGVSSIAMVDGCLCFSSTDAYCQFHADATFKLSDIGYPVITCGFTDQSRAYQVGAFFVVSRRTSYEYAECFRSFMELVRDIRGATIKVDSVMGDAEDAQYISFASIPGFSGAKMLMCFFHVLYNVRKRVQHLPTKDRLLIMASIVEMHYSNSAEEFDTIRDQELAKWRQNHHLAAFADYFEAQWLQGRYWQWQSYHNPPGFATTNNPCENLNGSLKLFLQRRRHHMRRLLLKLCDFAETIRPLNPVASDYRAKPTSEIVKAAAGLLESSLVQFETTPDAALVRGLEISRDVNNSDDAEEDEFRSAFELEPQPVISIRNASYSRAHNMFLALTSGEDASRDSSSEQSDSSDEEDTLVENAHELNDEEEAVRKQKDLYELATRWSLRRAHVMGMPHQGWWVDLDSNTCGCRYFEKFLVCAHLTAALRKFNRSVMSHDPLEKLKNRIKTTAKTKRSCSKQSKTKAKKTKPKAKAKKPRSQRTTTVSGAASRIHEAPTGRPPRTWSALTVQFIIDE